MKDKIVILFFFCLLIPTVGFARYPSNRTAYVPLMQVRAYRYVESFRQIALKQQRKIDRVRKTKRPWRRSYITRRSSPRSSVRLRKNFYVPRQQGLKYIGGEIGALGNKRNAGGDALGLGLLYGLRVTGYLPLSGEHYYFKPSLGYFQKKEEMGSVEITQQRFEAGAVVHYVHRPRNTFLWAVGLAQRLELLRSPVSIDGDGAGNDSSSFRYRMGPTGGIALQLGKKVTLVADFEITAPFSSPITLFYGLTTGMRFGL